MPSKENKTDKEISPDVNVAGKGRPTPTRKEREAANKRPLVPSDRKEAARLEKARINEERNKARLGLAKGEERYLPARDKGPQRKYVRDFVDARFSMGELMVPLMLVVIVMSLIPSFEVQLISTYVLWAFVLVIIFDSWYVGALIKKRVTEKFGFTEKGLRWYAAMRSLQMRALRLPKPQVKRREYPR